MATSFTPWRPAGTDDGARAGDRAGALAGSGVGCDRDGSVDATTEQGMSSDSGIGLYARRLRRTGATLTTEQALVATGLRTDDGQRRALQQMNDAGLVQVDGDIVTVKQVERTCRGPGRRPSVNGHRFNNERPGYRGDVRNGPVSTRPMNGQELAALTDDEVAERLAAVAEITDEGEVFETGIRVAVAPEDESYD